ncbi:MAG: hypothetical protein MZW92_28055 [Comamonadaceae bacterium]|nr:hypothetical protein [Comamonadaceae bacterium]
MEVYPEPDGPVDSALMDVAEANTADFIKLTPSHLSLLRRIGLERSRVRRMVVGGEDLKASLAAAVGAQRHGAIEIYNEYGPTEAVVGCVAHRYDPALGYRGQRSHRRARRSRPCRDPERGAVARSRGCAGRAVGVALRARSRVSRSPGADGRAVHAAPAAPGRAMVSHGGSRADDGPRHARVSRPDRSAAQGVRVPRGAWRGRGRAARVAGDRAVRRDCGPPARR